MLAAKSKYLFAVLCVLLLSFNSRAQVDFIANKVCHEDTTLLINTSLLGNQMFVDWDLDDNGFFNDAVGDTIKFVFPLADSNSVRLRITDSLGRQYYSPLKFAVVYPVPFNEFSYSGVCLGQTTEFKNLSTISDNQYTLSYNWSIDGIASDTSLNINKQFNNSGTYQVELEVISDKGCSSSVSKNITIHHLPIPDFSFDSGCQNTPIEFINLSTALGESIIEHIWKFEDNVIDFSLDTVIHVFKNSGNFSVSLKAITEYGCVDSVKKNITIHSVPNYSYHFNGDSSIAIGSTTKVEVNGDFSNIVWDNGSTQTYNVFSDTGTYWFRVTSGLGCALSDTFYIGRKLLQNKLQSANLFLTPNGDGKNDVLMFGNLDSHQPCSIEIFDINSLKVYDSSDYDNTWSGTSHSEMLPAGTYYYFLKCSNQNIVKGNVNLIK